MKFKLSSRKSSRSDTHHLGGKRTSNSTSLFTRNPFYLVAIICLMVACCLMSFASATNAPSSGGSSGANAPGNNANKPQADKNTEKQEGGGGIKCPNTGYVNVHGINVAQQVVNTKGEDIAELVRKEIEKQAPECNCAPCVCDAPPETPKTYTIPVPKCPCTIPSEPTISTCSTSHCFPEDIQRILNALQITACIPPQHTPCDCGGPITCII